jgi:hypothetical protein
MSAGDRWLLPDGREALELDGGQGEQLRLSPLYPGWPFPLPPIVAYRALCTRLPSQYLGGAVPEDKP